jgi:dienelactone hydrolase
MAMFLSHDVEISIDQVEPPGIGSSPAVLVLHGAGGTVSYWFDKVGAQLGRMGVACYAVHYFNRTGTLRADAETILTERNPHLWLETIRDAVTYVSQRPKVNARRIAVLGISLGGFLATALAVEDSRVKTVVEISGGIAPEWAAKAHANMAPMLIVHGEQDFIVPVAEARKLDALLAQLRVMHETEIYANEGHWFSALTQMRILMKTAEFLKKHL